MKIYPHTTLHIMSFTLPEIRTKEEIGRWYYPFNILVPKKLEKINFEPITIFYGSNGSGKSTLLNVIGNYLKLKTTEAGTDSEYMGDYVRRCSCLVLDGGGKEPAEMLPCKFIRSEYIMNKLVKKRETYQRMKRMAELKGVGKRMHQKLGQFIPGPAAFGEEDNLLKFIGYYDQPEFESNGEEAMEYFKNILEPDTIFLLDEPENSMSPKFVLQLARLIEQYAYYLNCQFIIATHSPFLLAMTDAKVYDLDTIPCRERRWTELANMKTYYDFFKKYARQFEKDKTSED